MRKKPYSKPTIIDFDDLTAEHQERLRCVRDLLIQEVRRTPVDDALLDEYRRRN